MPNLSGPTCSTHTGAPGRATTSESLCAPASDFAVHVTDRETLTPAEPFPRDKNEPALGFSAKRVSKRNYSRPLGQESFEAKLLSAFRPREFRMRNYSRPFGQEGFEAKLLSVFRPRELRGETALGLSAKRVSNAKLHSAFRPREFRSETTLGLSAKSVSKRS